MAQRQTAWRSGLLKAIGPGIMCAGAAIGVSHLVQSTRASTTTLETAKSAKFAKGR